MRKLPLLVVKSLFYSFAFLTLILGCTTKITPRPVADFDIEPVSGTPGRYKFTNKSENATRYQWTFGDGQATTDSDPTIDYRINGSYTVTLSAKNSLADDQVSKSIIVSDIVNQVVLPIADFDITPVAGVNGSYTLTNKSQNATRYQWTFGDGQATTDANPKAVFKKNGTFQISLTAKNSYGSDNVAKSVEVTGFPN